MKREEAIHIIKTNADKKLLEELEYKMGIDHEDSYDLFDAFEEVLDWADDEQITSKVYTASFRKDVHRIAIKLGWFREVSQKEYDGACCTCDKRRVYPKIDGIRYEWVGKE